MPQTIRPSPKLARHSACREELIKGSYTNVAGTLDYQLYRSATRRRHAPLFVMLHGGSQNAADFAAGTRMNDMARECGGLVLYPEQSSFANPFGCWNWFEARHQGAEEGEPSMIAGMTRKVMSEHRVDPNRVYVAGMSAGGTMAQILGQSYPDLYAAVGVHSGVSAGLAHDALSAWLAMNNGPPRHHPVGLASDVRKRHSKVATIVFHGDCDHTVHPSNAEFVHAQACQGVGSAHVSCASPTGELVRTSGGRAVTRVTQARTDVSPHTELWMVHGGGHAWMGGDPKIRYTDGQGPNASREMLRFFLQQRLSDRGTMNRQNPGAHRCVVFATPAEQDPGIVVMARGA